MIREHDDGLNAALDLLLDSGLVGARAFEKILVIDEPLDVVGPGVLEGSDGTQHESLIIFQRDEGLDVLGQHLVGIEWEGVRVVDLPTNLELLKSDLDLIVLALDLSLR